MQRYLKCLLITTVSVVVFFVALIGIARLTIPLLNYQDYQRDFFERWANHMLHQSVRISCITTSWYGLGPAFNFHNVIIIDSEHHKPLFQIAQLSISLDVFHSLLHWRLLPGRLILSGTEINVAETQEGKWRIKGMVLRKENTANLDKIRNTILLLSRQSNITLKNITINYFTSQGKLISVDNLQIVVKNDIFHHQITGAGRLRQTTHTRFRFSLKLDCDNLWFRVNVKNIVFKQLVDNRWMRTYTKDFSIKHGKGYVQLRMRLHKWQLQSVQGLVSAHSLRFAIAQSHKTVAIDQVFANLYWQQYPDGWRLTSNHIFLRTGGKEWPEHSFCVHIIHRGSLTTLFLKSNHFDLEGIDVLAESIGFWPQKMRTFYQNLHLRGQLKNLTVLYAPQTSYYHIISDNNDLGVHTWNNLSSIARVASSVDISSSRNKPVLQSTQSMIAIPQILIFRRPFILNQLQLTANWRRNATGWDFYLKKCGIGDNHFHWQEQGLLWIPTKYYPYINLQGEFITDNVTSNNIYLPYRHINSNLLIWLYQAFLANSAVSGTLDLKDPLNKFSFMHGGNNGRGCFDVIANVDHVNLHYHSGWPDIQNVHAKISFHNNKVCIIADHGEILGNTINNLKATIPNLEKPILTVIGHISSDLSDGFKFLQATPLLLADKMKNMVFRGPMNFNLKLTIPLLKEARRDIVADGNLTIKKSQLNLKNWGIKLDNIQGNFHFANWNFSADQIHAAWLGLPITIKIVTIHPFDSLSTLQLEVHGRVTIKALRNQCHSSILNNLSGSTAYHALLRLHNNQKKSVDSLNIITDLIGVKSILPSPYNKSAQESAILSSTVTFSNEKFARIKMRYSGHFVDANTALDLFLTEKGWLIDIHSPLIIGALFIPNNHRQQQQWQGHFSRVYLPITQEKKQKLDLQGWPSLNISIDDFRYGKRLIGKIELQTTKTKIGLKVNKLNIATPLFYMHALGLWNYKVGKSKTTLSGQFISCDLGAFLKQWGLTRILEGGEGNANFSLRWLGSPNQFEVAHLYGHVKASFRNGRMTEFGESAEFELGFSRLLNLLSLQSLPKLPLTLANLTKKGFAFNAFQGDFSLMGGIARTKNVSLIGDAAWVRVEGLIGFTKKNYDLHLTIMPNITSSLPLIIGIAGGPFAGIIAWIANQVLSPQVSKAAQVNYHITGSLE
ncbi:YhdP family phospholipid transporter [Coxiella endosymbiont of Amblyomma nuttalli]|uniref:YhdP family phospholipid transporter n=1 Tax=Coxiella endosymbiont of Amblyomma nuttalli TaxID=2749996 RepID=UPI001BACF569|nr:DUF3971 domain-containing protein [Coxiella endosymbiont of Amblyomma nuttalli]QTS83662.1 hypothetical protein CEAn_00113 [Coxiella endosymbiont of Amblyomma nuttalli]